MEFTGAASIPQHTTRACSIRTPQQSLQKVLVTLFHKMTAKLILNILTAMSCNHFAYKTLGVMKTLGGNNSVFGDISGFHGREYEYDCLL
jgi:hypothetical protein